MAGREFGGGGDSINWKGSVFKAACEDLAVRALLTLMGVKRLNPRAPL